MNLIGSVRFNTATLLENKRWKENNDNFKGCIYGCPLKIKETVPKNKGIYILEMQNDINEISGIGLIQNKVIKRNNIYKMYKNESFNSYIYKGKFRLDRKDFNEYELEFIKKIEILIFKGSKHLKRGRGITLLPDYIYKIKDLHMQHTISNMFKERYENGDI